MNRSFHAILGDMLARDSRSQTATSSGNSAPATAPTTDWTFSLENWSQPAHPRVGAARRAPAYTARSATARASQSRMNSECATPTAPPPVAPVEKETFVDVETLAPAAREALKMFTHLGAPELDPGVNGRRLRQAFRRLAKRLHPDTLGPAATPAATRAATEAFRTLQTTYAILKNAI